MSNTVIEKFVVKSLSQYGFFTTDDKSVYTKKTPESDKVQIVPGVSFEGEVWVSDKGARYLNKIVKMGDATAKSVTDVNTPVDQERAKKFVPKFNEEKAPDNTMTKQEWKDKDRSQLIGGLSHDAAAIASVLVNIDGLNKGSALELYKYLLEGMLQIREEIK